MAASTSSSGLTSPRRTRSACAVASSQVISVTSPTYAGSSVTGDTFGRPSEEELPWDEADPNSGMWATPAESRAFITGGTAVRGGIRTHDRRARAIRHRSRAVWPPDQNEVSLHHVLVRVAT